jgi:hypothetical protein
MAIPCITVTVTAVPANIIATNITVSTNACTEPCGVTVDVIWENSGGVAGTFSPSIKVDDTTPAGLPLPEVAIGPGETLTRSFNVTGLIVGSHSICPDPNP